MSIVISAGFHRLAKSIRILPSVDFKTFPSHAVTVFDACARGDLLLMRGNRVTIGWCW